MRELSIEMSLQNRFCKIGKMLITFFVKIFIFNKNVISLYREYEQILVEYEKVCVNFDSDSCC